MSHFAEIINGVVTNCVYVPNVSDVHEEIITAEQSFIAAQTGTWVQTSYNTTGGRHTLGGTPLRKNYSGTSGSIYDSTRDAFYLPQPYPSWTLNNTTCLWGAPVACPQPSSRDGRALYYWDEDTTSWVEVG